MLEHRDQASSFDWLLVRCLLQLHELAHNFCDLYTMWIYDKHFTINFYYTIVRPFN